MSSISWAWSYIRKHRVKLFIGLLMSLVVSGLNIVNPYFAGKIVDVIINGHSRNMLWMFLGLMIFVTIIKSIIRYQYQIVFETISQNVIYKMRENLYDRLQQLDFSFYDRTKTGDTMARMTGDIEAVRHFVAWTLYMIFENFTSFVFAISFMFYLNTTLALSMLTVTPIIGYLAFRMTKDVKPTFSAIRGQFSKLNSVVQENISGNRVVKAFANEDYEVEKFSIENEEYMEKNLQSAKVWEKYVPVLNSLAGLLTVVMIFVGGIMVITKSLTLGELVTFNSLIWALNNPLQISGWLINDVQRFRASAEKIEELMNEAPQLINDKNSIKFTPLKGFIEFEHISFGYGKENVLQDINFQVRSGQTIAIIGPTGAGKSTLVNLLHRFYDAIEGEIRVDGVGVKDWDLYQLRSTMAMVMQDIFLFSDTIEGNIAYGNPDASMESVQEAARMAEAHEFISELPEGYETIVGERGIGLSGGQRQRIALARALLKDPAILILDDTTSSVDMETERRIQKTFRTTLSGKTCLLIAHRISSVKEADLILVMDKGRIIERGTHEDLLLKKGYYFTVYQNQLGDFDVEREEKEVM